MMKKINWKTITLTSVVTLLLVLLGLATLVVAFGYEIDIRQVVCLIFGVVLIVMGLYFPKISYKNHKTTNKPAHPQNESIWRVFSRIMGISLIIEGTLLIISIFFPPAVSLIVICLLIGLLIGLSFYGNALAKK